MFFICIFPTRDHVQHLLNREVSRAIGTRPHRIVKVMSKFPRTALTLPELLVVIAIIGLLLALLAPAVQSARAAARRTQCGNHLRHVGLALHGYHQARSKLPVGCLEWRSFSGPNTRRQLAWSAFILPYLEQTPLYDSIDFQQPFDAVVNTPAARTRVPVYECPGYPGAATVLGRTDYGGLHGEIILDNRQDDGVFLNEKAIRFSQITDGLSNTMAVGEDIGGPDNQWINGRNIFVQAHGVNDPAAWEFDNEIRGPHPGGAMVLFCDASPRFLSQEMDKRVLGAMITRDRGELIE